MNPSSTNKPTDPFISIEVGSTRSSTSNRSEVSAGALSPDLPFSPFSHGYYSPCPSYRTRSRNPSSGSNASSSISNPRRISLAADHSTTYQYYAKSNSLSSHQSPFGDTHHHGRFSIDGKMKQFRGMAHSYDDVSNLICLRPTHINSSLNHNSAISNVQHISFET